MVQLNGRQPINATGIGVMTWIRKEWNTNWLPAPNIQPLTAMKAALPQGSSASFSYTYGTLFYPELGTTAHFSPIDLAGWYIAVTVHNMWGMQILWQGVVTGDSNFLGGVHTSGETGQIEFQAYGLELLLRQFDCVGSVYHDKQANQIRTLRQTLPVNAPPAAVAVGQEHKTRSASPNPLTNTYIFGEDEDWTQLEFLNYVLAEHVDQTKMQWRLAGDGLWMLQKKCNPFFYEGLSVLDVIGQLVEKHRGLNWSVEVVYQTVYIYIFSESALPYVFGEEGNPGISMNMNRLYFPDYSLPQINVNLSSSFADMYDEILVEGYPLKTIATYKFNYYDSPIKNENTKYTEALMPLWDPLMELDYMTEEDDLARMQPKYEDFQQIYGLTEAITTWSEISPACTPDGTVWVDGYTVPGSAEIFWTKGYLRAMKFDRNLPFGFSFDTTSGVGIDEEADPPPPLFFYSENGGQSGKGLEELTVGLEIMPLDTRPGFRIKGGSVPHMLMDGQYTPQELINMNTSIQPVIGLKHLYVTACMSMDSRPQLKYSRPPVAEVPRKLHVEVDAEVILMARQPMCVIDEGLIYRFEGENKLVKDERKRMVLALQNLISFCTLARRYAVIQCETVDPGIPVGTMLVGVYNQARYYPCNTVVTSIQWNFKPDSPITTVRTGGGELDILRSAGLLQK